MALAGRVLPGTTCCNRGRSVAREPHSLELSVRVAPHNAVPELPQAYPTCTGVAMFVRIHLYR